MFNRTKTISHNMYTLTGSHLCGHVSLTAGAKDARGRTLYVVTFTYRDGTEQVWTFRRIKYAARTYRCASFVMRHGFQPSLITV